MRCRNVVALVLTVTATALGACNDDGRSLAPAPTVPASVATLPSEAPSTESVPLRLSSESVGVDGVLPADFTCDGLDVVPSLSIAGVTPGAAELALTLVDLDADGYVHLAATGIPPSLVQIGTGALPTDAVYATTDGGTRGWEGPCPPRGTGPHRYVFTLWLLPEPLGLSPDVDGRDAVALIGDAAFASTTLEVTYERAEA